MISSSLPSSNKREDFSMHSPFTAFQSVFKKNLKKKKQFLSCLAFLQRTSWEHILWNPPGHHRDELMTLQINVPCCCFLRFSSPGFCWSSTGTAQGTSRGVPFTSCQQDAATFPALQRADLPAPQWFPALVFWDEGAATMELLLHQTKAFCFPCWVEQCRSKPRESCHLPSMPQSGPVFPWENKIRGIGCNVVSQNWEGGWKRA